MRDLTSRGAHSIAAVALLAATACSSSPTAPAAPPGVGLSPAFEQEAVTLVNQQRASGASCGQAVGPVSWEPNAGLAARDHSIDMATNGYFSHTSLDGRTSVQRLRDAGYAGQPLAENIAQGQSSPAAVMSSWMANPSQCRNIMLDAARDIGVGYANGYWTMNVGG